MTLKEGVLVPGISRKALSSRPYAMVAVGTGPCNKQFRLIKGLAQAGVLHMVQWAIFYDSNEATVTQLRKETEGLYKKYGTRIILPDPEKIPATLGFLRDPNAYKAHLGELVEDIDRMFSEARKHSELHGAYPQFIIEHLGFGGHANLGLLIHKKANRVFHGAFFLVAALIPDDPVLARWMRQETWHAFQETLAGHKFLVTDNKQGYSTDDVDHRLAIGLASIEASAHGQGPRNGSLADVASSLSSGPGECFGLSVSTYYLPSEKGWTWRPPFRQTRIKGGPDQIAKLVKNAIKENFENTDWQLAIHDPPPNDALQHVTITLPLLEKDLNVLKGRVLNQQKKENFRDNYPETVVTFAAARFSNEEVPKELCIHVTRMYVLQGSLHSVDDIMRVQTSRIQAESSMSDGRRSHGDVEAAEVEVTATL